MQLSKWNLLLPTTAGQISNAPCFCFFFKLILHTCRRAITRAATITHWMFFFSNSTTASWQPWGKKREKSQSRSGLFTGWVVIWETRCLTVKHWLLFVLSYLALLPHSLTAHTPPPNAVCVKIIIITKWNDFPLQIFLLTSLKPDME